MCFFLAENSVCFSSYTCGTRATQSQAYGRVRRRAANVDNICRKEWPWRLPPWGVLCLLERDGQDGDIYIYILIYALYVESWDTMWHIIWISHDSKYGYTME